MEERVKRKYTLLNIEESGRKFVTLLSNKGSISLQSGDQTVEVAISVHKQSDLEIYVELEGDVCTVAGDVVYGYELHGVKYLGKGFLKGNSLTVKSGSYRLEKREHERLMVWPHYKVHAYFSLEDRNSNVESINKSIRDAKKSFNRFMELKSKKINGSGEVTGMRVLDVSRTGLSFLANRSEVEFFSVGRSHEILLDFNGMKLEGIEATVVYTVDYIDPKAKSVRMYKVGMNFNSPNEMLNRKLEEYLGKEIEVFDLKSECKNFSEFVDKD